MNKTSSLSMMRPAMIASPKAKKTIMKTKKWTMASDDKSDKMKGIKEDSAADTKIDTKRGLMPTLESAFSKLRGGK